MTSPVVSTEWLTDRLLDPTIKVIEIANQVEDDVYSGGHIPGAIRFFWKDLCWHDSDRQFVTPEQLAERLGRVGISEEDRVVLYGNPVQYGNYAFWALTMAGHPQLFVLDGARAKWIAEGGPMTRAVPETTPVEYEIQPANQAMRLGRDDVRGGLGDAGRFLLDVRSPEEYSGERVMELGQFDHGAERGGRIPGAKHMFFKEILNDDDTYKSADEIRSALANAGAEPDKFDEIVIYCRLSHRATLVWTALTHILGHDNIKIYDGSWTEWGSIVGFPVEK